MGSTEHFSWFDSGKSDKKTKKDNSSDSSGPKYINAPIGPSIEHVSLENGRDSAVKINGNADHPRVLPETLFKDLLTGDSLDAATSERKTEKEKNEPLSHVPIPVEQSPPPAARAERPMYEQLQAEQAMRAKHTETTAEDDDDDDDDEAEEDTPKREDAQPIVVPLDAGHEGAIPTQSVIAEAVERLAERLDEAAEAAEADGAAEAAASPEPFIPLESEPEARSPEPVLAAAAVAPGVAPSAGGGSSRPPAPPRPPAGGGASPYDAYNYQPAFTEQPPSREAFAFASPVNYAAEQVEQQQAIKDAEKRGFRKAAVATAIMTYVVTRYLAGQKQKRFEAEAERRIQETQEQVAQLTNTNTHLQQKLNAMPVPSGYERPGTYDQPPPMPTTHFEQPLYPQQPLQEQSVQPTAYEQPIRYDQPLQQRFEQPLVERPAMAAISRTEHGPGLTQRQEFMPAPQGPPEAEQMPQVIGEDGQEIVLQPGQWIDRRGPYAVVRDQQGHEVQGAVRYGKEYYREQRQEHVPVALANTDTNESPVQSTQAGALGGGASPYVGGSDPYASGGMLGSGQADPAQGLPSGQVDMDHRLSKRQNPIIATLANPVLWLAFALIVIAYFITALI